MIPKGIYYKDKPIIKAYKGNEVIYGREYDPLVLFKDGKQGAWFDPSDLSTLFQDAAGTIPVAASGDPIGLVLDKSGNGNHIKQTQSASRLTYHTDGLLHWFTFDGVDDYLEIDTGSFFDNQSSGFMVSALKTTGYYDQVPISVSNEELSSTVFTHILNTTTSGMGWVVGQYYEQRMPIDCTVPNVHSHQLNWETGYVQIRQNSAEVFNATVSPPSTPLTKRKCLVLGSQVNGTFKFKGNIYAVVLGDGSLDSNTLTKLESYLAAKSGVTL